MQTVSSDYSSRSKSELRNINTKMEVDWDLDGVFTDEPNILLMEYERGVNEPLGGIHLAQGDIVLANSDDRYTPGSSSPIEGYLIRNRPTLFKVGYQNEYLQVGKLYSGVPKVTRSKKDCRIHFFDSLQKIHEHKLSEGGELYLDIRVDRYVWGILDDVYGDEFTVIASCDPSETWTNGADDTTNHRGGEGCISVTSSGGVEEKAYMDTTLDISGYGDDDYIFFFVYVEDHTLLENLEIRLHDDIDEAWFHYVVDVDSLQDGWNHIYALKSEFVSSYEESLEATLFTVGVSEIGGADEIPSLEPHWNTIQRVEFVVDATDTDDCTVLFDELRVFNADTYPFRYFNIGLQTIPVAWWAGNTALYEIKIACESEGSRFYADEQGNLRFENRQHYNNTPESKVSVHEFTFDRVYDYVNPNNEVDVINSVRIKLQPRVIQAEQDMWSYGFRPQIAAGATKTIWAELTDPAPTTTTGIVAPVATTDYEANAQEDGLGTDKTADVNVTITRFTNAVKIDVENTDASPVYLTLLKLRGTPAKEQDPVFIDVEDGTSVAALGRIPAERFLVENKYMADETYATNLAQQIIDWYKDPLTRITLKNRAIPQLQLGDMVSVVNDDTGVTSLMRIMRLKSTIDVDTGMNQEVYLRSINPFETLTYFEIGTSSIESTDVIAP